MVEGAVEPHVSFIWANGDMQPGSVQEVRGEIRVERDIAEVRGKKGSLHPRKSKLSFRYVTKERGNRDKAELCWNCHETVWAPC